MKRSALFAFIVIGAVLLMTDHRVIGLLINTFLLAGFATTISLPVGTFLGVLLFRTDLPGRILGKITVVCALFIPLYIYAAAWSAGFGQLGWFAIVGEPPRPILSGWFGAIWVHAMVAIPWVTLIVGFASTRVDQTLEQQRLLETNPFMVLVQVTLRMILPAIVAAIFWNVLMVFGEMTVTDIFRVRTFAEEIYLNYLLDQEVVAPSISPWIRQRPSFVVSVIQQIGIGLCIGAVAIKLLTQLAPIAKSNVAGPPLTFRLNRYQWPFVFVCLLILLLMIGLPLGSLIYKAGLQLTPESGSTVRIWSFELFAGRMGNVPEEYGDSFWWSGLISLYAMIIVVPISLLAAWWARLGTGWRVIPAICCFALGVALSGPSIAVILILLLDQPDIPGFVWVYDRTLFAPAMAIAIRLFPLTILFCWYMMRQINPETIEHAKTIGIKPVQRFLMFGLMQNLRGIFAVALMAAIVAFGDLTASNLVVPPGVDPLSRRIFGFIHAGTTDQVAILCLANILLVIPLILLLQWLVRKFE